ncbi:immunoglobulin omega chain-like [Erinaceus europaeus]|uniref:immunoglobulin omega chain-like n=1 Tax=Erinaceus europaeus TaxID=9365 RepID=UPI0028FC8A05|nr:immunoglobulin omega chain-like [Erinaceus europaeus]
MSWLLVLLVFLVHCTDSGPQPMLNQPPSASSSPGATIRLACTLSSDHDISLYSIYWYQQRPGQAPTFLLRYSSHLDKHQDAKIPLRFSGSKDVTTNTGYLNIAEVQPEDEAVYYCAIGAQSMEKERHEDTDPAASGAQTPQDRLPLN